MASDELVANQKSRVKHGATENEPLNEAQHPHYRGVRVALGTGYYRVRGIAPLRPIRTKANPLHESGQLGCHRGEGATCSHKPRNLSLSALVITPQPSRFPLASCPSALTAAAAVTVVE